MNENIKFTLILILSCLCGSIFTIPALAQNYPTDEMVKIDHTLPQMEEENFENEYGQSLSLENEIGESDSEETLSQVEWEEWISHQNQSNSNTKEESLSKYTLGSTDIIEVTVMRHPEVSGTYIINKEGRIQYEFIGDVSVAGKTKLEVEETLSMILSDYILSPQVNVKISGYNSKIVYVIGEVAAPGKVFIRGDTITIREALLEAGLPLLTAKASMSVLITPAENGRALKKKVNIHKLLYKGDLRENYAMSPGDTLYIPPTAMAKIMRVIQPVSAPIGTAAGTGRTLSTGF